MEQEYWKSILLTPGELEKRPDVKGWSMWRINTLRKRYKLMPPPLVKPHLVQSKKDPSKVISKGRLILYSIEIIDHLKKIDRLQQEEGLTYKEIAARDDIKKDLEKYKLLNKTELSFDTRVIDEGFFANFYSAKANLARIFGWQTDSRSVKFLDSLVTDRASCAKEYFDINKRMRKQVMEQGTISRDLEDKKDELGYKLDYLHSLMKATTDEGVRLLKDKKITMEQWFQPLRELGKR